MLISVFTPTYNRATLLHRVFESLEQQTFRDFEWIVLDDGSTDDTTSVLEAFRQRATFPIKTISRRNRGKAQSINEGLFLADGELFICFDSDDWCVPSAFERISQMWRALGDDLRPYYSGLSCLKCLKDGSLVGEDYSRMSYIGDSYVDRFNRRIKGDKWEIIRTDVHRENLYDVIHGEKYMAPEYAWLKIGRDYKTLFINECLSIVEYQKGGISNNNIVHRSSSPLSASRFYKLAFLVSTNVKSRTRSYINFERFQLHGKTKEELHYRIGSALYIIGYALYVSDSIRLRMSSRKTKKNVTL